MLNQALDLSDLPPVFILSTHLQIEDLHEYEDHVYAAQGALTYKASEARVFLGRISQMKRASFELRSKGIWTDSSNRPTLPESGTQDLPRGRKRKQPGGSGSSSDDSSTESPKVTWPDLTSHIIVIRLEWLDACLKAHSVLPYHDKVLYSGKLVPKPTSEKATTSASDPGLVRFVKPTTEAEPSQSRPGQPPPPRPFGHPRTIPSPTNRRPPKLSHGQTTVDSSDSRSVSPRKLPSPPEWTIGPYSSYSCCRSTPMSTPNAAFIAQLSTIKLHRILILDAIGVRAYSTSIASISAYPHSITSELEILQLPGCNNRIADLWREWHDSASADPDRTLADVTRINSDPEHIILLSFYNIWGVGADTARKFYYTHGLRDLDDIVEYHWSQLNRVQQIGVKFYAEFQQPIPRAEVEDIAATILRHARTCKRIPEKDWSPTLATAGSEKYPNDICLVIVGGYRRGKTESGDVDVILSHRDEVVTHDLVLDVVRSLETEGWITHTLTLQTTTSDRDQQTLPYRSDGHGGHGFDSLDKALCVWQDPTYDSQNNTITKNPNIHRRVDIILSPWRTVGCAVLGWSGGTTFQRDIRKFAQKVKGWKFDSSGVRDRGSGVVVDLEGRVEVGGWEERERSVMEGIGVGFREAWERCTG